MTLVLLVIPAIALRLAVVALYGRQRRAGADPMQALLSMSSGILFAMAALGFAVGLVGLWLLVIPLAIAFVILGLMVIDRLWLSEHRALLWALSTAAQKGVPLAETARAYSDETQGDTGYRSLALAEALERGESLTQAVRAARLRLGAAMKLAVGLGERLGMLGPAMRQQLDDSAELDAALQSAIGKLSYVLLIIGVLSASSTFVLLKIVPVYQRMFEEFGLSLPRTTTALLSLTGQTHYFLWAVLGAACLAVLTALGFTATLAFDAVDRVVPTGNEESRNGSDASRRIRIGIRIVGVAAGLALVLMCLGPASFVLLILAVLFAFIGWFPRDLPLVWWLFRRYDGALVMRGMALAVRRSVPIPQALTLLEETYPLRQISRQLQRASQGVMQGQDWRQSLRRAGLIGQTEVAVLAAAQRAGHLDWALEEMADSALRRQIHKIEALIQFLFPVTLLLLGGLVFFLVVALFMPLVSLIQGLT